MGREKTNYNDKAHTFKRVFGVKIHTFKKMKEILDIEYGKMHRKGGSPPKMSVEDKLYATLKYLREYRTMESIGGDYGVTKSTICESVQWVENTMCVYLRRIEKTYLRKTFSIRIFADGGQASNVI
jgi:hypothetical protein